MESLPQRLLVEKLCKFAADSSSCPPFVPPVVKWAKPHHITHTHISHFNRCLSVRVNFCASSFDIHMYNLWHALK